MPHLPLSRRRLLQLAGGGLLYSAQGAPRGPAKAVIQVWLWGGACHIDTFDPKPNAGYDYCGPLSKPIPTALDGIFLSELLPKLAGEAQRYSLIRSLTHGSNAHETASFLTQTGRDPGDRVNYPSAGAVVSSLLAPAGRLIPPYIVLTEPQGRFSEAGFLGARGRPFATGGDPNAARFAVEGIVLPGVPDARQRARRALLRDLDALRAALPAAERQSFQQAEDQAYELILGDGAKVFDLSLEPAGLRDRYGRHTLGQSCLAARRLVEAGVPYVTINAPGWDTHRQHFPTMRRKLPELDQALSSLLADLDDRGLLASTLVWCCGEFGRTPRVQWEEPWNGGRNHHGAVFSALVAGGGLRGGRVVGSSDERGEAVATRPVAPGELLGALYTQLGFDPDAPLPNPQGVAATLAPPAPTRLPELL